MGSIVIPEECPFDAQRALERLVEDLGSVFAASLEKLNTLEDEKDAEISVFEAELGQREEEISDLENTISSLEERIEELETELRDVSEKGE